MKRRALIGTAGLLAGNAGCLRLASSDSTTPTGDDASERATDSTRDEGTASATERRTADGQTTDGGSSAAGVVVAFGRDDGTERWRFRAPRDGIHHHVNYLATHDGTVFAGSDDSGMGDEQQPLVFALDAATSEERYVLDDASGFLKGLFVHESTLYVATVDGDLFAHRASDGSRETVLSIPTGFGPPAVVDGEAYVPGEESVGIDLASGQRRWATSLPDNAVARPAVTDDTVYVGTRAGHVTALDRATGEQRWQMRAATQIQSLSVGSTALWAGDDGGTVYAYDPADGTELYRERSDDGNRRQVAALGDLLCVGRPSLAVYRVEDEGDAVALTEAWSDDRGYSDVWAREGRFYAGWNELRSYGPDGPSGPAFGPVPDSHWPKSLSLTDSNAFVGTQADDD